MSEPLEQQTHAQLTRLEKYLLWKRREVVEEVRQKIQATDTHIAHMQAQQKATEADLEKTTAALAKLQSSALRLKQGYQQLHSQHGTVVTAYKRQGATLAQLQAEQSTLTAEHQQLQTAYTAQNRQLAERDDEYQKLWAEHEQLNTKAAQFREEIENLKVLRSDLQAKLEHTTSELIQLQTAHKDTQKEYKVLKKRYDLVCQILGSEPQHPPAWAELKQWLAGDFAHNVQRLELPADDTTPALERTRNIAEHVELLVNAPALREKFLIAVAGGFSSGKSSFVSSFMDKENAKLLPTGIQPVTAIPSYVVPGTSLRIEGRTFKGAHMPLTPDDYGNLTHDFIANMGFNIKTIMPYVVIQSPMRKNLEHIAFIDMPGYNPGESEVADTAADEAIASAALYEADAVIWLVGLDSQGTLPSDDIEFLQSHVDPTKFLYVVLNKADTLPLSNIEVIVKEVQARLQDAGIVFEGISAYSAKHEKEIFHFGKNIEKILLEWDERSHSVYDVINEEFKRLIKDMEAASKKIYKNTENSRTLINELQLDLRELLLDQQMQGNPSTWLSTPSRHTDRAQKLQDEVDKKFKKLQLALSGVELKESKNVLKKSLEHGQALLRRIFEGLETESEKLNRNNYLFDEPSSRITQSNDNAAAKMSFDIEKVTENSIEGIDGGVFGWLRRRFGEIKTDHFKKPGKWVKGVWVED